MFVPSEMPLSIAHFWPAAYHGVPFVLTPSTRARIVTIMPRVVVAFGLKPFLEVPFIRPFSETYFTASSYQLPAGTSVNEEPVVGLSSFGLLGFDGVTGVGTGLGIASNASSQATSTS